MKQWREAALYLAMGGMLIAAGFLTARETALFATSGQAEREKTCVVIDAGHGGDDPGKIGSDGTAERDINLQIAKKVKRLLDMEGVKSVMTRTDERGLYDSGAENKKVQDMKRRVAAIEEASPELTISIHQNSYPEEAVRGAQVFYYKDSEESRAAAELLQKSLKERLDTENHREAKANASYYLLKKTSTPVVIVECGFLSNESEAALLRSDDYQERVAWAVFMGVMQALNAENSFSP